MARQAAAVKGRTTSSSGRGALILFVITMIVCGALFIPTAVMIIVGMLPAIVAYLIDNDRKKSVSITVALMNASGVVPFVIELWKKGQTLHQSFAIVERPMVWLVMYGAAAMGWLIIYSVPAVVQALLAHRANARIADIDKRHEDLAAIWGEHVRTPHNKSPQKAKG